MKMKTNWFCIRIVLMLFASVNAVGFYGLHFKGLEEPAWIGPRTLDQKWMQQPIDHFNHRDNRTWLMRYYEEDKYFNGLGPIFIMLGGEWTISPGFLQTGLMHSIAKQHGALMFYTEHRYYGHSKPTQNISSDNMQYLNVDQALADIAYFIDNIKIQKNIRNSIVIVFGASYSGNMAAWMRIKYPHLIQGAVASSAPVFSKAEFNEYYELVTNILRLHDSQCEMDVKAAFDQIERLLSSEGGSQMIREIFNLCENLNVSSMNDISYFMDFLSEIFADSVQFNTVTDGMSKVGILCETMTNRNIGRPIERLAKLVGKKTNCNDISYSQYLKMLKTDSQKSYPIKQWLYQSCSEFGYFTTSSRNPHKSAFGTLIPLDFFINLCTDLYGYYNERNLLERGIRRTHIMYGENLTGITRIIFINGDMDPWHYLSVLSDLNEFSPAILIHGSSHCQDFQPDSYDDVPELRAARQRIRYIVSSWLE